MRMRTGLFTCLMLAACSAETPTPTVASDGGLELRVADGRITGAATVNPGWVRVRVNEDGAGHIVIAIRLPENADSASIASLVAALDTAADTPSQARALGGPESGDSGEVVLDLAPGQYVFTCLSRGDEGHRHGSTGERLVVTVPTSSSARAAEPATSDSVLLNDFAYSAHERWPAGTHLLRVVNRGTHDHQMRIVRLDDGVTMRQWLEEQGGAASVAGVARMGPGVTTLLPVTVSPGHYVLHCLLTDPGTGKLHVMLGMLREVVVE